jgi:aspartate/methionine/tyrosine aminotransferase
MASSNPQNPTGAMLPNSLLKQIAEIAAEHDLILFADEIYRPLFHSISPTDPEFPPSVLSLHYPKAVATGSMSKAFALAGIRIGWVASRDSSIIEACASARDYTNISVSQVDDQIATFALDQSCVHALLGRNIQLAKTNLEILGNFLNKHAAICSWVRPRAGTTAFVRFSRDGKAVNDVEFCKALQRKTGVFVAPGNECFGEEHEWHGFVRIGYVCETEVLKEGLAQVDTFLAKDYAQVPTVE